MSNDSKCARPVKSNRAARGAVLRAQRVEVPVYLEGTLVLVRVSRAEMLRALRRAQQKAPGKHTVPLADPFEDGMLIVGDRFQHHKR